MPRWFSGHTGMANNVLRLAVGVRRSVSSLKALPDGCLRVPTARQAYEIPQSVRRPSESQPREEKGLRYLARMPDMLEHYECAVEEMSLRPSGYYTPAQWRAESRQTIPIPGLRDGPVPKVIIPPLATKRVQPRWPTNRDHQLISELRQAKPERKRIFTVLGKTERVDGSTYRMNQLARQIKGLTVSEAIVQMRHSRKAGGVLVAETLEHLIKQAQNSEDTPGDVKPHISAENMLVAESWVCPGTPRKGITYHGKGRHGKLRRRAGHTVFRLALAPEWSVPKNRGNMKGKTPYQMRPVPKLHSRVLPILRERPIPLSVKRMFLDC